MGSGGSEKKKVSGLRILIGLSALVVLGYVIWAFASGYGTCDTWSCFNNALEQCEPTKFVGGSEFIFQYTITGMSDEGCEVNTKLLQGALNAKDSLMLEGKEMVCLLPPGVITVPEQDLKNCHGLLKEGIQELTIGKLHDYLVQNLGRINLEALDVPGVT
jgi:hypothetical protein